MGKNHIDSVTLFYVDRIIISGYCQQSPNGLKPMLKARTKRSLKQPTRTGDVQDAYKAHPMRPDQCYIPRLARTPRAAGLVLRKFGTFVL